MAAIVVIWGSKQGIWVRHLADLLTNTSENKRRAAHELHSFHIIWVSAVFCPLFILPGKSKAGIKYKGTVEVPNLSDENDMEDLDVSFSEQWVFLTEREAQTHCGDTCHVVSVQISISLNKDEPETPLIGLMKTKGADKIREALGSYVGFLKTGIWPHSCSRWTSVTRAESHIKVCFSIQWL